MGGALADFAEAEAYAICLASSQRELRAYLAWLWEFTHSLIGAEPHWSAVKALAGELVARGEVGERRARAVIKEALTKSTRRTRTPARQRAKRIPLHA